MLESTVGQILVNDSLPEDLRDYSRVLDKSALSSLLKDVARKYPERYREISFELSQVGRRSAQEQGGFSFGARHLRKSKAAQAIQQKIKSELMGILSDESLTDQQRTDKIVRVVGRESSAQQKAVLEEAVKENNPLGLQVLSGSRGKPMNLASLLAADMLYSDHRDEVIPIPVLRSYSQGLTPAEYWAGTYGARRGIIATKFATQEAGFLCLAGDTMVRMADWSVKAIRDIKPGDMVIGSDKSGNTFPVKVSAKFENGKKELWRFRFRFGKSRKKFVEIVATKEHKALIEHLRRLRRRPATKLVIQTKTDVKPLGECERRSVSWHALLPVQSYTGGGKKEPLAWLIGWLIGEGGLTGHNTNVSGGDVVLIEEAKRRCKESGFSLDKRKNKDYEYTIHDDNPLPYEGNPGGGIAPNSFRCRLRKRLSELGLLQLKAHQKFIPDEVFSWDNESIAELIAWLIAGDGCVASIKNSTIPAIQLGLTADKVVRQVAELLMCRFGIYSQITVTPPQEKGNFPVSHLAINDRESVCRFLQYIGCATGAKQSLLLKLSEAIKPAFRRDKFLFHYFDKEYVGIEDTFDIEVDHPDHLFVLENGAIVSNSKQLNQAGHRLVVVDEDTDEVSPVTRGLIVDTEDMDNEGSLLAQDTGPFKRNTPLTPKILKQLKRLGKDRILVRSPLVGGSPEGGVYARDVGVREKGLLPGRGEQVGLQAAQALSEPISQGQLCLAAGTLVRMADWTVKPIEQITIGDLVLGADICGNSFPVCVVRIYDNGEKECVRTIFSDSNNSKFCVLDSTPAHKILTVNPKSNAYELLPIKDINAQYFPTVESQTIQSQLNKETQVIFQRLPTYDIEVDHPDHLFVLANGLIVSNSAKHSGGVAGQEKAVGGFQYINQLIQTPKKMQGGAAHSTVDGMVQRVEPAPAGGSYVIINGEKNYVNAGYELKVKKGDEVEAGDLISDGIPNPAIITKYKGVGEGRRYFVREFKKAMASSGMFGHRRNIELLARGLINHVRLTEEVGEHVQDDIIPYSTLEHTYTPREGFQALAPKKAVGKYLERPVLHYTIGTKVRPSMLKDFDEFGVTAVDVHDNPPPFESHMVRGMYQLQHDPDWLTQMYGSGLKESLLESVARGGKSEQRGSSFVPSLATGTDFGDVPDRVVIKPQAPYALPNVKIPDLPDSLLSSPTPKMPEKLSASIMPPNV